MSPASGTDAPQKPVISIIVVHYRTPALLGRCLETIAAAGTRRACEVLVMDNAPLDSAARELAERWGACYHGSPKNVGYGPAVNRGLARARGRYLLVLNPDIEVEPGSVDALADYLDAHPSAGMAAPRLQGPDGALQHSARRFYTLRVILLRRTPLGRLFPKDRAVREHLMADWDHADARDVDWVIGGAVMVRREAADDVGGMDERFFLYFEDVDWCSRMHRRGWHVVYVPHARMIHAHQRASARGFLSRGQRVHLASALRFYEKWSLVLYIWKLQATTIRGVATLLLDLVLLSAAFFAAYLTRYLLGLWIPGWLEAKPVFGLRVYARFVPFADLVAIGAFYFLGLYRGEVWRNRWRELLQLVKGIAITSLVVLATTFLFTRRPLSRFTILLYFPYALLLVAVGREFLRRSVVRVRERRIQLRRLAVFAAPEQIDLLKQRFARHGTFGYEPIYLAHDDELRRAPSPVLDPVERRVSLLADERIAEVAVFESRGADELVARLLPRLLRSGLPVLYVPLGEAFVHRTRRVQDLMGFGALSLGGPGGRVRAWTKRIADVGLALVGLAGGLPFHLIQRISLGRSACRTSARIGRMGRPFPWRAYRDDTWLARAFPILRYYPLLPLVLSGEMSFVGISPLTPEQWSDAGEAYRQDPPDAPAGILGPPAGADRSLEALLAWNRTYVEEWSLAEDMRIVLETLQGKAHEEGSES